VKTKGTTNQADLMKRIAELESQLGVPSGEETQEVDSKIQLDDLISVMSLLPYTLNLSTLASGKGRVIKFTHFGEVKRILYKDLLEIMENNSNFLEAGYFYILHPALIRHHGLGDVYSKILTKEKIEEVLGVSSDESLKLYESANFKQQEVIIQTLIDKVKDNPDSVDLNMVDKISRVSKVDIVKRAEDARAIDETVAEK
jgi:hypothetical protein